MLSQRILLKVIALRGVWRRGGVVSVFCSLLLAGGLTVGASPVSAQLPDRVEDYWASSAELVWRGTQALKTCYGLFLSNRTLDQIHEKELMGLRLHGPMDRDRVAINYRAKTVEVGVGQVDFVAPMKSAYREGIGCVVMAPHQNFIDDLEGLPSLELPPFPGDAATIAWPDGDRVENKPLPAGVNQAALDTAGDWAFDRITHGGHQGQVTTGMMVVYQGDLIYERYAPGFDMHTATRMWSSAKGLVSTLFGIAVDKGILEMDEPIPVAWPHGSHVPAQSDPRRKITLRHLLNMSSGLYSMDREYNWMRGSHMVYFGGWDGGYQHRDRGLVAEPGTYYNYQNGDAVIPIMALRNVLDEKTYKEFPHVELLRKIGMRDTTPGDGPVWKLPHEQPDVQHPPGHGSNGFTLPEPRALERRADPVGGLCGFCANPSSCGPRPGVRRLVPPGPVGQDRSSPGCLCGHRCSRAVHDHRSFPRSGDRPPGSGLETGVSWRRNRYVEYFGGSLEGLSIAGRRTKVDARRR